MKNLQRRSFIKAAMAAFPLAALQPSLASPVITKPRLVRAGADRLGVRHKGPRANSHLDFKISTRDTAGALFLLEHSNMSKGGPVRHLHHGQEEWFYLIEGGEVIMEIGDEKMRLKPGDSVLAPREVPHVWAYIGDKPGRMLIAFTPAGRMEAFFIETSKPGSFPGNVKLMREHGMEMVGPPLQL